MPPRLPTHTLLGLLLVTLPTWALAQAPLVLSEPAPIQEIAGDRWGFTWWTTVDP